ncbi:MULTISPECIES: peptide chain release factor N(5)-glutamine methyltransferase [Stenotrophomonas]|uniref:peptide chain release factor N(5)-glutamine methyltransferase n=1 Tax=Stenotrophomonas TaxID=40323 RepID=UPI0006AC462C|nr:MULTISPECIES: peptide chain release factor N(5)-glutamine methyltransferase [Stenotrophomonas]KOQ60871.1 SAM-dependent methyltransferase [Stenotrophomonas maltophilia]MCF3480140.1 peptide chain release factor N(5)-glutamine methyltransferase [Stenotrophomonas maltophilia]MCF3528352.1 peptide chain release factor N(5)-glutamine methyltransferase [Stenotrophomonas maltophilia]MCF3532236.1 peptide chain release factor N(5)-glutamine methyltransferase [Stenotrophomonas maltophilia]OFU98376.1 pr
MSFQPEPTLRQVVADASARLGGVDARHEAELLLLHVLERPRSWLFAHATDPLAANDQAAFEALLARRVAGEPVAYLTGRRGFWTLDLEVDPATLIPRPETELLVELALERLPPDQALQLADLGTGSGAIALALASERPRAQVLATDASPGALAVAARNAARHELDNVRFAEGGHDWYAPLQGVRFDLIASNPPYIASNDPHLEQGDLRFEPSTALASGMDGLDDIRRIVEGGQAHLRPGGWLLIEHGWDQGAAIRALFEATGFAEVQTVQDLEQRDRITLGRRPA